MPGVKIGKTLTCDDLTILFYDYCVDPPVLKDPYEVFYTIVKVSSVLASCCEETVLVADGEPLRSSTGKYYVPELPMNLEPGQYKVKWKFRSTEECTYMEICQVFTLYEEQGCRNARSMSSPCVCFS